MAHAGVASRRKCEAFIQEGRVKVNGEVVRELGFKVGANDKIEVDSIPIYKEEPVYFMFYKPKGVLSSASDDKGRTVVTDYFKDVEQRVYPVGRLDYDTTGLLLLTNDGEFSNLMTHPKHHVEKKYIAKVKGIPVDTDKGTGIVALTIHEGWNHQVKRMFEAVELPVMKLKREEFGFLTLENLRPGDYRELRSFEVQKLRKLALDEETKRKTDSQDESVLFIYSSVKGLFFRLMAPVGQAV